MFVRGEVWEETRLSTQSASFVEAVLLLPFLAPPLLHFTSETADYLMKEFLTQETIDFLAGSAAGALSIVVGQPFDTIKVSHPPCS